MRRRLASARRGENRTPPEWSDARRAGRLRTTRVSTTLSPRGSRSCRWRPAAGTPGTCGNAGSAPSPGGSRAPAGTPAQRVAPVVVVAGDQRRQVRRRLEFRLLQQQGRLPAALALRQAEMHVNQVQRPLRRLHHRQLRRAARAAGSAATRPAVADRPARQHQVAVTALAVRRVELVQMPRPQPLGAAHRLVVVARTAGVAVHLLKADQVRPPPRSRPPPAPAGSGGRRRRLCGCYKSSAA